MIEEIFNRFQSMKMNWRDYKFLKTIINKCAVMLKRVISDEYVKSVINYFYMSGVFGVMLQNGHEQWYYRRNMKINDYIETSKYKLHQGLWKVLSIW